jgi:hypothetical protein
VGRLAYLTTAMFTGAVVLARYTLLSADAIVTFLRVTIPELCVIAGIKRERPYNLLQKE